jgi:hypothetical protein
MKRTPEEILERMDALLDEYDGAKDKFDRGQFADKFGQRLGAYSDKLKPLNGDDFDIVNSAYDEHKSDYSDMSDDDYVNALEENIKSVIAKIWPEKSEEEVAKVAEEVAENAEPTETTVEVTEETPSDENLKRTTGPWKNPCESGGRDGKCGLPGQGKKVTSDEECKEKPEEEKKLDEVVEATPTKVDDVVKEVLEAKPEDVEPAEAEDDTDFEKLKNDPVYKRMH